MKNNLIGHGFVAPEMIEEKEYVFGASLSLPSEIIIDNGDWCSFLPKEERQSRREFDTYGCTIYNTLQAIEILENKLFGRKEDYSERFIYIKSGTRPPGNNPHIIGEHIRKIGLVPEVMLAFSEEIDSLEKYADSNSIKLFMEKVAEEWLKDNLFGHEWVFNGFEQRDAKTKNELLREELRRSPIGVSVVGWRENNGIYYKLEGEQDNHWTDLVAYENGYPIIYDSYEPFLKKLDKNYDFGFAKRYRVSKTFRKQSFFGGIKKYFYESIM